MPEPPRPVTCLACGWASTVPPGLRVPVDGGETQARCWRCGDRRFRAAREDDAPVGATLNDVLPLKREGPPG